MMVVTASVTLAFVVQKSLCMLSNDFQTEYNGYLVKMSHRRSNTNNNPNLHTNYIVSEIAASVKAKLKNDEDNCFCGFRDG
jgi:hypothetical protein